MRPLLVVLGAIALLLGVVWALQGAGVLLGSFMSNDPTWLAIGLVTGGVGAGLLYAGLRRRAPKEAA